MQASRPIRRLLTALEVQDLLSIDRSTVYRMAEDGRLPAIRVGRSWRFPAERITSILTDPDVPADSVPAASTSPAPPLSLAMLPPIARRIGAHGFLCARAFIIRSGHLLVGMVLAGGVSPSDDPEVDPDLFHLDCSARQRVLDGLPHVAAAISMASTVAKET